MSKSCSQQLPPVLYFLITFMYVGRSTTGPSVGGQKQFPAFFHSVGPLISRFGDSGYPLPTFHPCYWSWQPQSLLHSVVAWRSFLIPVTECQALALLSRSWDNCEAFGHCRQKPVLSERILGQSTNIALSHALRANCLFGKRGCLDLVS